MATDPKIFRQRFASIIWANHAENYSVAVVGAGGIGSWLTLFLSRIGYKLYVFDFDDVDDSNIGGQFYPHQFVGRKKIVALRNVIDLFTGNRMWAYDKKATISDIVDTSYNILVSCVDKMSQRKMLFDGFKRNNTIRLFIDGRMNAEQFTVYFVTRDRMDDYEKTLYDDDEVPDEACTNKATTHFGAGIAYTITKGVNNFVACEHDEPRDIPFMVADEGYLFTQKRE